MTLCLSGQSEKNILRQAVLFMILVSYRSDVGAKFFCSGCIGIFCVPLIENMGCPPSFSCVKGQMVFQLLYVSHFHR